MRMTSKKEEEKEPDFLILYSLSIVKQKLPMTHCLETSWTPLQIVRRASRRNPTAQKESLGKAALL